MATTISKQPKSPKKKVEAGTGHPEPVEQGKQGGHTKPVVVEPPPRLPTREELMLIGKDYELTDMIYGKAAKKEEFDSDVLPESSGELGGVTNNLQLFINMYQPGELVTKRTFRELLLKCLKEWAKNHG
jgi:hypothetical protein